MRENCKHGSEGGDGESRFRPLSEGFEIKRSLDAPMEEWLIFHGAGMTNRNWNPDNKLLKETLT